MSQTKVQLIKDAATSEDSIVHDGDTNTKIRFPAADTISAETAGSERVRVDSSGNVGIGTTNPAGESINGSQNLVIMDTTSDGGMNIKTGTSGNAQIHFSDTSGNGQGRLIYAHANDSMQIYTAGSERFRIDSSGNVGIGTTSPQEILHVKAASEAIGNRDGVIFGSTDSLAADKGLPLVWAAHIGTDADYGIASICGRKENATNDNGAGYIQFGVGNAAGAITECARFISSGFLKAKGNSASYHNVATGYHELIGDTVHDVVAKLKHNSSTGYGLQTLFNHANANIYALSVRDYSGGTNTDKAFIRCDGDLENANNSYGGMSDVKLKENIVDAKSQWDDIKALKVRNFNYKVDENKTKLLGLVAQEAEAVCPSLVKSQPDLGEDNEDLGTETKVLKYSIVYMKAVKALQEAMAKIEVLETKVAALEAA